ncbi:MAG: ABC transporter permease subunit [Planctomycetota bacterium]|nr:MAG: ABC transporter permease subunit [Planctomycetota bacterium]
MKKSWWWLGWSRSFPTWAFALIAVCSPCRADDAKPLLWAADAEGGAPFIFKDPKNPQQYKGFEVEIAGALARELGRPIHFKQYEYVSLFSGLERGDFDFAMNGLEITPDRKQKVLFSRPYYLSRVQFVTRAKDTRFRSIEDCKGKESVVVGTLEDTAASRLLTRLGIRSKSYTDQVLPYEDLANGRIDGVLLDLPIAIYFAARDARFQFTGEPLEPSYYAIAVNKNNPRLVEQLDGALDHLLRSGELQRIYETWGLWNQEQKQLLDWKQQTLAQEAGAGWTFRRYFPDLAWGAVLTVFISCSSMLVAIVLGLPIALLRLYGPAPVRWLALLYVEFFRGIPVLLLLYFLYFGLPSVAQNLHLGVSLNLGPLQAAILGLGLNYAAYESEIYRTGISSLPVGQWEAAASLGKAFRIILPPMTNDFVGLFKDTSIVSIIAVEELMKQYMMISKAGLNYLETGLTTAALYLIMSVPLGYLSRYLEKLWSKGEVG